MTFKDFLEGNKELASLFKSKIQGVPQDPDHHPEGDVLIHTKLVRKAVPHAIQELKALQKTELSEVLQDVDFSISPVEMQILVMAAWIHDIGKSTATTIDGQPWRQGGTGRIQAIGHQDRQHFIPQLKDLENSAPESTKRFYYAHSELIDWLVEHHMDFAAGQGFSKKFISENFAGSKLKPLQRNKLLLILMFADKMGRKPEDTIKNAIQKNVKNLQISSEKGRKRASNMANQSGPFEGTPQEFIQMLQSRNLNPKQISQIVKNKFPDFEG